MMASWNGHLEVVRTLLEAKADINDKNIVRNQMMMMMMMMTILMMMILLMVRIEIFVDYDDRRSMYLC